MPNLVGRAPNQVPVNAFLGTAAYRDVTELNRSPVFTGLPALDNELIALAGAAYPVIRPSLNLDFVNSQSVDSRITFTRASTATRINALGVMETVAANTPRIDYDPVTLACKGLLIEEARTNLMLQSGDMSNATWSRSNMVIVPNSASTPYGTLSASKLVTTSGWVFTAGSYTGENIAKAATAIQYTSSVYAKAGEFNKIRMFARGLNSTATRCYADFNLTLGTKGAIAQGTDGFADCVQLIIPVGDGWYRCSITYTTDLHTSIVQNFYPLDDTVIVGDGVSGIHVWGVQLEVGAFPTSYIPTVASQVTRAADVATMTGSNFSSWYRQDEGTFVVGWSTADGPSSGASGARTLVVSDGTSNERLICYTASLVTLTGLVTVGQTPGIGSQLDPTGAKAAYAYKLNDAAMGKNGLAVVTDATFLLPVAVNQLSIASNNGGGTLMNGYIRTLSFFPKRLTNSELQTLST